MPPSLFWGRNRPGVREFVIFAPVGKKSIRTGVGVGVRQICRRWGLCVLALWSAWAAYGQFAPPVQSRLYFHGPGDDAEAAREEGFGVAQAPNGLIYIGLRGGVYEFDGTAYQRFVPVKAGDAPDKDVSAVSALAVGADGNLYVGGKNLFGFIYPEADGKLKYYDLTAPYREKIPNKTIGDVEQVFVALPFVYYYSSEQLFIYHADNKTVESFPPRKLDGALMLGRTVVVYDNDHALLLEDGKLKTKQEIGPVLNNEPIKFAVEAGGKRIIGTTNEVFLTDGLDHFEPFAPEFVRFLRKENYTISGGVATDDHLIVSTYDRGCFFISLQTGKPEKQLSIDNGLPENVVNHLFLDKDKSLWMLHDYAFSWSNIEAPLRFIPVRPDINILALVQLDDKLYVGANNGLYVLDIDESMERSETQNRAVRQINESKRGLRDKIKANDKRIAQKKAEIEKVAANRKRVKADLEAEIQKLRTDNERLAALLAEKDEQIEEALKERTTLRVLTSDALRLRLVSEKIKERCDTVIRVGDRLVVKSLNGLFEVYGGTARVIDRRSFVGMVSSRTLPGRFYAWSRRDGVTAFQLADGQWKYVNLKTKIEHINSLSENAGGELFAGTNRDVIRFPHIAGVFDGEKQDFKRMCVGECDREVKVRRAAGVVYAIPADEKKIWRFDPQKGLFVFEPVLSRYIDPSFPVVRGTENETYILHKNKLYRITAAGVDSTQILALAPRVTNMLLSETGDCRFFSSKHIIGVDLLRAFGERYAKLPPPPVVVRSLSFSDPGIRFPDLSRPQMRLSSGTYQLRIECAAAAFHSAFNPPTYEYAVVESENDAPQWTVNDAGNILNQTLREGANLIYVRLRDGYGQTGEALTISVYVRPPLYRTLSAYLLYAVLVMAAAQLFVHYNDKIKQTRIEKLEAVVRERTEEVVKANDELRSLNELLDDKRKILEVKNAETQAQNLRLESQNKLISEQNAELRRQKDELNRQKNEIERHRVEMAEAAPFVEIGEIMPIVIHELNNPFAAMGGSIEWLRSELNGSVAAAAAGAESLPPPVKEAVWEALERLAGAEPTEISGAEERRVKKDWTRTFAAAGVAEAEDVADRLVRLNARENWSDFAGLGAYALPAAETTYKIGLVWKQIHNIRAAAARARELVENLRAYIRQYPEPLFFDVREPLDVFLKFYRYHLHIGGTEVEVVEHAPTRVYGLPQLMLQVWRHTIMSAVESLEGKGKIRVEIRNEGEDAALSVIFNVPPFSPEKMALFVNGEMSADSGPAYRFHICRHNVHRLLKSALPLFRDAHAGAFSAAYLSTYGVEFFSEQETTGFVVRLPAENALRKQ